MKSIILLALLLSGCATYSAREAHVKFGVPSVFTIEKGVTNLKVTEQRVAVADTETKVQILLFVWESNAKGVVLTDGKP